GGVQKTPASRERKRPECSRDGIPRAAGIPSLCCCRGSCGFLAWHQAFRDSLPPSRMSLATRLIMLRIHCPECRSKLVLPDEVQGKHVRCPHCLHPLTLPRKPSAQSHGIMEL